MNRNSNRFLPGPGYDQYQVPIALFEENRLKLATRLSRAFNAGTTTTVGTTTTTTTTARVKKIVVVKGGISPLRYDTDHEPIFRQESYFWWLTGVKEPDCIVVISILMDIIGDGDGDGDGQPTPIPIPTTTIHTTLFVPQLPCEYATIMGKIRTLAEWKEMYGFDEVLYTHELEKSLVNDNQMLRGIAGAGTTTTTTTTDKREPWDVTVQKPLLLVAIFKNPFSKKSGNPTPSGKTVHLSVQVLGNNKSQQ